MLFLVAFNVQKCAIITKPLKAKSDLSTKNYVLNEIRTVQLGVAMLSYQEGQTRLVKEWVGLDHSPTGFETKREYSDWFYKQEIMYQGSFDGRVSMFFQEFIDNFWQPSGLRIPILLNIKDSKIFKFKQYIVEILDVKTDEITFRVLSDSETWD